ncbi:MAG: choice-of-anchor L domain-containing protein [Pirellulaceae bacterium]|nr:choice-of-anchor L domain-containing protein [Pirellulaceae bacterium]
MRKSVGKRGLLLEKLEDRMLLALLGPKLGGIQPNDGDLLAMRNADTDPREEISVRNVAPSSLTFRFDERQVIDPSTLGGIRIVRSGFDGVFGDANDVTIVPGYIGVADSPQQNEVIVRFAEALPDDLYRIQLFGADDPARGIVALRNTDGLALGDTTADNVDNGSNTTIDFELKLGPQVIAVVPQPITRVPIAPGSTQTELQQARNQIQVYFNNDDLFVENDALGNPTARSAENPAFYQLIYTRDSVTNTDDVVILPTSVRYDAVADMATLTFAQDLDRLVVPGTGEVIGQASYRLRIGTNEPLPPPPTMVTPVARVTETFNTGGAGAGGVDVTFTARNDLSRAVNVTVTKAFLPASAPPQVSVTGQTIQIVLNENAPTTAGDLQAAVAAHPAADALVEVTLVGPASTNITVTASALTNLRVVGLGSSFDTASDLATITGGATYLLVSSSIDPQPFLFDLPGASDEPGHRNLPVEMDLEDHINPAFGPDQFAGITTIPYNFRLDYGFDAQGNPVSNSITETQKQRVREAIELWANYLGVQFLETENLGITFVTGDTAALNTADSNVVNEAGRGFRLRWDPTFENSMLILSNLRQWNDEFGANLFREVMIGLGFMLGLARANDLPSSNLMAYQTGSPSETIYPGNADIIHGQHIHRPDSNDIDLYRFTVQLDDQDAEEPRKGLFTAETFAERLPNSSLLNTVLSLYREVEVRNAEGNVTGYARELIARNEDYFSSDSYISMELGSGTYYVAVTSSGNTDFDPVIEDTGFGGTTQGVYDLRFSFRTQVDENDTISDLDRINEDRPGSRLDGDLDGIPGGVYNFWFQTRPLEREIKVTGDGGLFVDGQTLTLEDGARVVRRFEFDNNSSKKNASAIAIPFDGTTTAAQIAARLVSEINTLASGGFRVSARLGPDGTSVILTGDRVTTLSTDTQGVQLAGKTIFVDKTSGANLNGSLNRPFDTISAALAATVPGDIVRIVGNGGLDGDASTIGDNFAYEIGLAEAGASQPILQDGSTMEVPKGVTVMVDAGAIFKLRRARIGVGSSTLTVDRSGGVLQVLGTPHLVDADGNVVIDAAGKPVPGSVYFTSRLDEATGRDGTPGKTTPQPGDWGGIVFRSDLDSAESRRNLETNGVFLNYVNHADMRYGGGLLAINSVDQVVNPIQIIGMRPTVSFNRISFSADAAMSADPDSFEETNFHSPRFQLNQLFTSDYDRVGPDITGNVLQANSINALFVRIATPAGTALRSLTVPGRFDDVDIVHVISENLKIQGDPGKAILETERPSVETVTSSPQGGGALVPGTYTYKLVFVDSNGFEGRPSEATAPATLAAGQGTLIVQNLPSVSGNFVARRLYRSQPGGSGPYVFVADLNAASSSFRDNGSVSGYTLQRDPPSVLAVTAAPLSLGGLLPGGLYNYRVVFADEAGNASPASDATAAAMVDVANAEDAIRLSAIPQAPAPYTKRLIYRSTVGGDAPYALVGELDNAAGNTFDDLGGPTGEVLSPIAMGVLRARLDARLKIDPGTVIKLEGSRIEVTFGAQLIAEGVQGKEIIFTAMQDDRYGAGGTFDTNKDGGNSTPQQGTWGGLYIGHLGQLNVDHAYIAFGGGDDNRIEGTFTGFNVIELHQARTRIANSIIEQNALGTGGQGPVSRFGRGTNAGATIFVRGSQPVLLNNIIRDNADVAININADAFTHQYISDPGRTTGDIDQVSLYRDNRGPLIRGNAIANNGPTTGSGNFGYNGMEIRSGIVLSTESVWDDTDIVHILYNQITVREHHTYGGLRLQSSPTESLVIKMLGDNAGFTATGRLLEMTDRIGGVLHVVGHPGFPVVITSIHDDTVGAGLQPDGRPQTDTNNNDIRTAPSPGDWRSVLLDQFSHDRNVEIILEQEAPDGTAPGINATVETAQFLGELAPNEQSGDENLRMGFQIVGFLNAPNDVDVYSFTAMGGTEIWLDIDRTRYALDTVIEVLNSNGQIIAQSNSSWQETIDPDLLYHDPDQIAGTSVNPLQRLPEIYQPRHVSGEIMERGTVNPRDAGLRVVLPGARTERGAYMFRIRSSSLQPGDSADQLQDISQLAGGLTSGIYHVQLRMQENDEFAGSTVRYADIRYATNGVELIGLPKHSPLLGEVSEDEEISNTYASNDSPFQSSIIPGQRAQYLGNLLTTDRGVISIAGNLSSGGDVDWYQFQVDYAMVSSSSSQHVAVTFDMDYADGLTRPNTTVTVFQRVGDQLRPILVGRDSNVADDRSAPLRDADDLTGVKDLSRGSVGSLDPFIGTVYLPEGTYYVAVTSDARRSEALDPLQHPNVRLEPINSVIRIAEDRIGGYGGTTAVDPVVPILLDPTFVGTSVSPDNLWHVSNRQSGQLGHGVTPAFDGSRLGGITIGLISERADDLNNSIGTAQSLETQLWSLNYDPDIGSDGFPFPSNNTSQTIPHMTLLGRGDGASVDYYSFLVENASPANPAQAYFDIDYGWNGFFDPTSVELDLALFDAAGTLLASNDGAPSWYGADGSTSSRDPFISYAFTTPGTYVIGVAREPSTPTNGSINGRAIPSGTTYTLHASVEGHDAITTLGGGGQTFYFGNSDPLAPENYDVPGTTPAGDLISNAFSLKNYSASDKPVLYFNYRLDTEGGDHFRVYVQRPNGTEELMATSNSSEVVSGVISLYSDDTWRQARIQLDQFAGMDGIRIRYNFTSNGPSDARGVHVDDVLIGFAERGEMITQVVGNVTDFVTNPGSTGITTGAYQLEIRQSTPYGRSLNIGQTLVLEQAFDTNARFIQQTTLVAPAGHDLRDGDTFRIGDGASVATFEFDSNASIQPGNVRIQFSPSDPDYLIAQRIRNAINSSAVQSILRLQAETSDGAGAASRSNLVNLFGASSGDIVPVVIEPLVVSGTVEDLGTFDDGNSLRAAIVGSGVAPVGQANLVGGTASAGFFTGGLGSIGIASGIVLSTGDVASAAGPNLDDRSSGIASGSGDADLDAALGITTTDAASLEFQFSLAVSGTLYFDYVFASEEYNENVLPPDGFAILVKPQGSSVWTNYALVPGTGQSVSTGSVNRTTNSGFFRNNDPSDAGRYLRYFGYDGFTDVLQAAIPLAAGIHAIKFVVGDVGDQDGDTAVLISGGSFSTQPSVQPVGIPGILHEGFGDQNHFRDQGQTLVHSNTISHAKNFAIVADAGVRDIAPVENIPLGPTHPGPVRNLRELNNQTTAGMLGGFTPGPVIMNNTIYEAELGGIHVSGDLAPWEIVPYRGGEICDGDWFTVTVYGTQVTFEFEDLSLHAQGSTPSGRRVCPANPGGGDGWTNGRVPIMYDMVAFAGRPETPQWQIAERMAAAINGSVLGTNGTTMVVEAVTAPARSVASSPPLNFGDVGVYVYHARQVVSGVPGGQVSGSHTAFQDHHLAAIAHGPQPFTRVINNTIYGTDGSYSSYPDNPANEPNDTIFNAVDTRQGRQASPEEYRRTNVVLGNTTALPTMPSADVDMYKFQMDIFDHALITIDGNGFAPEVRLFNARGEELLHDGSVFPGGYSPPHAAGSPSKYGTPLITRNGNSVTIDMYVRQPFEQRPGFIYADEGGPYYVAVSGGGNNTYSPISLGSRQETTEIGTYNISVNVLAGRRFVFDTLSVATGTYRVTDVDGRTWDISVTGGRTSAVVGQITSGIAQGLSITTGPAIRDVETTVYGGNETRFVIVDGAAKIVRLDADPAPNFLTPVVDDRLNFRRNDKNVTFLHQTGVFISEESTPTVLNNVLANTRNGIIETDHPAGSPRTAVVGGTIFQHNQQINWTVSTLSSAQTSRTTNADFNLVLGTGEALFVDALDANLFPAQLARSIDSSVGSLEDRPSLINVKRPMGLSNSPIIAPKRDATGQLRIDDPAVDPPQGVGDNVFIDRGSLDRSDFVGPVAELVFPRDNDTQGLDIDPTLTVVHLLSGVYPSFSIQLIDGFELADPFPGVGVNDNSVLGPRGSDGQLPGAAVTVFQNGVFLEEERDYSFRYDPISNTIHLIPISGIWRDDAVYVIDLNNRNRYVINAPRGDQVQDADTFEITDGAGTTVTFEYDTGYYFDIPQSLALQVPRTGVTDGQRFQIRDASNPLNAPVTFEIDFNNFWLPGNQRVQVQPGASANDVAQAIVNSIDLLDGVLDGNFGLGLNPKVAGEGLVHLGGPRTITANVDLSNLTIPPTILTLAIPAIVSGPGVVPNVADGQRFSVALDHDNNPLTPPIVQTFEFDTNNLVTPGNNRINIASAFTVDAVGEEVVRALANSTLNLTGMRYAGNGLVYVNNGGAATINPLTSGVFHGHVARPLADGERFTIEFDDDSNPATPSIARTFEYSTDGVPLAGTDVVIPFSLNDTHEDLGEKTAVAIRRETLLDLPDSKHLTDGRVYLGGTLQHEVDLTEAPTISPSGRPTGRPEVQTTSRLNLPGYYSVLVPASGGATIVENSFFTITDTRLPVGQQTWRFEFDSDGSFPPGAFAVNYLMASADQLANNIISAINSAKTQLSSLGFLAGVTPSKVVDDDGQIVVELTGANGFHSLNTASAPNVGQRGGRIGDSTFVISYEGTTVTFEFDSNGVYNSNNTVILYTASTSLDDIAAGVVAAIRTTPALNLGGVQYLGKGVIDLFDTSRHLSSVPPSGLPANNQLTISGIPGGAVRLAFEPWENFSGEQFAQNIIDAINDNQAFAGVTASLRGGNTVFVDFRDPVTNAPVDFLQGPVTIHGISNYFLRAIQDLPGNWLKANQFTDKTTFTILLPGAQLDFGDAPDSLAASRYPTLFQHNGARHVISDPGFYLGSRVDADPDGQTNPAGWGDDLDHIVDLGTSPITLTGLAPYVIQVPAAGVVDQATFTITAEGIAPVVFEFVDSTIPDNEAEPGHVPVSFDPTLPAEARVESIAQAIILAVSNRLELGLSPVSLGNGVVFLGGSFLHRVDTRGTALSTSGEPAILLRAVPGADISDGQRFTIDDGRNPAIVFQFGDAASAPLGVQAVPYDPNGSAADTAAAILAAVLDLPSNPSVGLLEIVLTDLGDGQLHVAGIPSHELDLTGSGLLFSGHTPAELVTPGAGWGIRLATPLTILLDDAVGGGVDEGQTFTIQNGNSQPVVFEFDGDGVYGRGHVPVAYNRFHDGSVIASAIVDAIEQAVASGRLTGVTPEVELPAVAGDPLEIQLNSGVFHLLDTTASGLGQRGPVEAGETFEVEDGSGAVRVFEFVRNAGEEAIGHVPVVFQDLFTANDIANAIVAAVESAGLGSDIDPRNYANGDIQIGGDGEVRILDAANLTAKGQAGGVLDGQTFAIHDGNRVRRFEFDADRKSTPGNLTVVVNLDDDATALAEKIVARVAQAGYRLDLISLGGGLMRFQGDDDDGIYIDGVPTPGSTVTLLVTASQPGFLDGWIDYNNDGDFLDQYEHVYASHPLEAGVNELTLNIPIVASIGERFARFRLSKEGGLAPTGLAISGEVEDHIIQIFSNSPPILTVPRTQIVDEDVPLAIRGISVFDADAGMQVISMTLTVLNGTLTVNPIVSGGLSLSDIKSGNGTNQVVVEGTQNQISNTLAHATGLVYQGNVDFNGPDLLTIVVDDLGNTGTGGPRQDLQTVPLTVLAINDAPELTVPAAQQVDEDSVLVFPAGSIQVFDVEYDRGEVAADTPIELTLTVNDGVLSILDDVTDGVLPGEIVGNGTRSIVLLATPDRINATLAAAGGLTYTPDPDFDAADVLTLVLNDLGNLGEGGAQSDVQMVAINIVAINDAPVLTVPGNLIANEDVPLSMVGFNVSDVDSGNTPIIVTLAVTGRNDGQFPDGTLLFIDTSALDFTAGDTLIGNDSSVVTIEAPVTRLSALLSNPAAWQYIPPLDFAGDSTSSDPADWAYELLMVTVEDRGATGDEVPPNNLSDSSTITLFVNEVNDPPEITAPAAAQVDEDQWLAFTGGNTISVFDSDLGAGEIRVTVTAQSGTVAAGTAGPAASIILTGTLADVNANLADLRFRGNANFNGIARVIIVANDQGNWPPPAMQAQHTVSITVAAINDPPQIAMPGPLSVVEDQTLNIPLVSVSDVDAFEGGSDGVLTVVLSVSPISSTSPGTLTVAANVPNGLPPASIVYSAARDQVTLTGTAARINTTLGSPAGLVYQGAQDDHGTVLLHVMADDGGKWPPATGSSASQQSQTITIIALNDAPVIGIGGSTTRTMLEDGALAISDISVSDVDAGNANIQLTLAADHGILQVTPEPGVTSSGDGSTVVLTGSQTALTATLASGVTYQPVANFNGTDTIRISADDLGNSPPPARTSTAAITVVVQAVNDPPVLNVPGPQSVLEDTALSLPPITVSDPDINEGTGPLAGRLRTTFSVQNGTLSIRLDVPGGILPTDVLGNGTATVTVTSTPDRINTTLAALNGLRYQPTANYNSFRTGTEVPALLTITADDLGNTGGAAQTTTATVPISVVAVNDPPQVTLPGNQTMDEDRTLAIPFGSTTVSDIDALDPPGTGLLLVTLTVAKGKLTVRSDVFGGLSAGDILNNGTAQVSLTGPASAINATLFALNGVVYTPNANYNGSDVLRVDANDLGNTDANAGTPSANPRTVAGSLTISIAAVNDPPTLVAPAALTANEDQPAPLPASAVTGFFVADVDALEGNGLIRVTFAMFNGRINVNTNVPGGVGVNSVTNNGTTIVSVTATPDQINATLAGGGVAYQGNLNYFGTDQMVVTVTDSVDGVINHGKGGTVPASATVAVTINPVNDAPVLNVQVPASIAEDTPAAVGITVTDVEMGSGAIFDATLTSPVGFFTLAGAVSGVTVTGNGTGNLRLVGTDQQIKTTLEAANAVSFQGNQNFNGPASLTVTIVDRGTSTGDEVTVAQTVNFTVTAVNDPPVVQVPASLTVFEDTTLSLGNNAVRVTDVDSAAGNIVVSMEVTHGRLTVKNNVPGGLTAADIAGNGTSRVVLTGTVAAIGLTLADSGGLSYLPNLNFFGNDTLTVTADDRGHTGTGGPKVVSASAPITVTAVNDPPRVANPIGRVDVLEDAPNRFIELFPGVFEDPDNTVLTLTVTGNTNPSLVQTTIQGTLLRLVFQPNQSGTSTVSVTASDGQFSATDTFTVNVTPVPDPPFVANPIADVTVLVGTTTRAVNLNGVFDDPDIPFGDTLTLVYNDATDNTNRNLVTGSLTGQTLNLQFSGAAGQANLTVHAVDSTGRQVSDSFTVTVNAPPVARNDSATTRMNTPVNILVTSNDTDADGTIDQGSITVVPGSGPLNGTVSIANGLVTYTPNANYWNRNHPRELGRPLETFRYTVQDNQGFVSNEATVSITVTWVAVFQNPFLNADVNRSGHVSPIDALAVINYLNTNPSGELPPEPIPPAEPEAYYDVNGDGIVSAQDVLIVINFLNGQVGLSGGEGEAAPASPAAADQPLPAATPLLVVADYSLTMSAPPVIDMGLRLTGNGSSSGPSAEDWSDWNTVVVGSSRDAEFADLAGRSGSLADHSLDDLLGDIASAVGDAQRDALAEDWAISALAGG